YRQTPPLFGVLVMIGAPSIDEPRRLSNYLREGQCPPTPGGSPVRASSDESVCETPRSARPPLHCRPGTSPAGAEGRRPRLRAVEKGRLVSWPRHEEVRGGLPHHLRRRRQGGGGAPQDRAGPGPPQE